MGIDLAVTFMRRRCEEACLRARAKILTPIPVFDSAYFLSDFEMTELRSEPMRADARFQNKKEDVLFLKLIKNSVSSWFVRVGAVGRWFCVDYAVWTL